MTIDDTHLEASAEQARQEAEAQHALLETLFENLPLAVTYFDTDMRVLHANARYEEFLGTDRHAAIGRIVYNTSAVANERRPLFERALAGEANFYPATLYRHPDGSLRYYDVAHIPVKDRSGKVIGLISTLEDVTQRKRDEERERLLSRLSESIRLATDLDELAWTATKDVGEYLGVRRCFFAEIDLAGDLGNIRRDYCNGVPSVVGTYRLSAYSSVTSKDMEAGKTVVNCDSSIDERTAAFYRSTYEKYGERAYVAVPLIRDGLWVGVLWASDDVPRQWTGDEISLLETVAERVWLAIEKLRSEKALQASEERLAAILEQLPVGVSVFDHDGNTVLLNSVMRRFVPEILPSRDPERIDRWRGSTPEGAPLSPNEWPGARALRGESVVPGIEYLFTDEDGREIWTSVSAVPLRGDKGEGAGAIAVIQDIDDRKRVEEAIRERSEWLRSLANLVPGIVWTAPPTGAAEYVSERWYQYTGSSRELPVNESFLSALHPEEREQAAMDWSEAQRTGTEYEVELRFRSAQGDYRWFLVRGTPIRDEMRNIAQWFGIMTDIHEKKLAEQRKDEFIALAAHEMRTPLTAIKGFSQVLLRGFANGGANDGPSERAMRTLQIINSKADSLNQLINDMLDVSRIERGELLLQREPFDLTQLVSEVVGYQALVHEEFEFKCELATQPVTINGDRQRIEQVLTNLIENAAKYSGSSRRVAVSTETRGLDEGEGEAVVAVKDHGVGIPAHEQQRVFERFFQATNATSAHRSGLGLGLYITQGIVARHGGRMWLESAVGDGSTFYVALPLEGSRIDASGGGDGDGSKTRI